MNLFLITFFGLFSLDRGLKLYFLRAGEYVENSKFLIGNFDLPVELIILVVVFLIYLFSQRKRWGLFLILVGGVCNLVDRLYYGYVIDYMRIGKLPVFNVADVYINIGVGLFILELLVDKETVK